MARRSTYGMPLSGPMQIWRRSKRSGPDAGGGSRASHGTALADVPHRRTFHLRPPCERIRASGISGFGGLAAELYNEFHLGLALAGLTATIFVQLASVAGSITGGWLADFFRKRTTRGRILVQAVGVLCGAPFVAWCGLSRTVPRLILALTAWGFCKGMYDANIFASLFDVVQPEARGSAAGFMNSAGWLGGGGAAPVVIGVIARWRGLGAGITAASAVYLLACALLLTASLYVKQDAQRAATFQK